MHHLFSSLRLFVEIIGGRRCLNLALHTGSLRVDIGREVMALHQVLDHTARGTENCNFWFVVSHCFHLLSVLGCLPCWQELPLGDGRRQLVTHRAHRPGEAKLQCPRECRWSEYRSRREDPAW